MTMQPVMKELIVNLHDLSVRSDFDRLISKYGYAFRYAKYGPAIIVSVPENQADNFQIELSLNCNDVRYACFNNNCSIQSYDFAYKQAPYYEFMNVYQAFAITEGDPNIIISVGDTGCDYDHPDTSANLLPGIDLTGTGFSYDYGHGSMVIGQIIALRNSIGISGTAPRCRVLPIKMSVDGYASMEVIVGSIEAASQFGAKVHNLSYSDFKVSPVIEYINPTRFVIDTGSASLLIGGRITVVSPILEANPRRSFGTIIDVTPYEKAPSLFDWYYDIEWDAEEPEPDMTQLITIDPYMDQAVTDAWLNGMLTIVSAGNNGKNGISGTISTHGLSIGALSVDTMLRANYSNFGNWVDVYSACGAGGYFFTTASTKETAYGVLPFRSFIRASSFTATITDGSSILTDIASTADIEVGVAIEVIGDGFDSPLLAVVSIDSPTQITVSDISYYDRSGVTVNFGIIPRGNVVEGNPIITGLDFDVPLDTEVPPSTMMPVSGRLSVGSSIVGQGIPDHTFVIAKDASSITISQNPIASYNGSKLYINRVRNYTNIQGTSFAAPLTSGLAGLMFSINPDISAQQVSSIIKSTSQLLPGPSYYRSLDLSAAVQQAWSTLSAPIVIAGIIPSVDGGTVSYITYDAEGRTYSLAYSLNGGTDYTVERTESPGAHTLDLSALAEGMYQVKLRITPLTGEDQTPVESEMVELVVVDGTTGIVEQLQAKQSTSISALNIYNPSLSFLPVSIESTTLSSAIVAYGTQQLGAEQTQQIQTSSSVASLSFIGTTASTQVEQSSVTDAALSFTGSVSETQKATTQSAIAVQSFNGNVVTSQVAQVSDSIAVQAFSGSVIESQNTQAETVTSVQTITGSANQSQPASVQTSEGFGSLPTIAFSQQPIASNGVIYYGTEDLFAGFEGVVVQLTAQQQQIVNASLSFTGSITQSQKTALQDAAGSLNFAGTISEAQSVPQQAVIGNLGVSGLSQAQVKQSQVSVATLSFIGALSSVQAQQRQSLAQIVALAKLRVTVRDPLALSISVRDPLRLKISVN